MAIAKGNLGNIVSVSTASTVGIYTNPSSTKTYIKGFVIHNVGVSSAFCKMHEVPNSGGSVGAADSTNRFFSQFIDSGETTFLEYPYPLTLTGTNDSIRVEIPDAGMVNFQILGDKDP
jgi:hypothetical protein